MTTSAWMRNVQFPTTTRLAQNIEVDVCIVGAGIAGLSAAYELCALGRKVLVIDAGEIGSGQTGRTTAHLSSALDDRFFELERLHGTRGAKLAAESHRAAIDRIATIVGTERISCGFQRLDGFLFLSPEHGPDYLEREAEAALRVGQPVERLARAPLPFESGPCLKFPDQGEFHPLEYLAGLAQAILARGGAIHTDTPAVSIEDGRRARVVTKDGHEILAQHLIVATNVPINDRTVIHTKQAPYRSYVIAAEIPTGSVTPALYWDTQDPYHYVRTYHLADSDLLIIGGEDHKTGQDDNPERRWSELEAWARPRFPMIKSIRDRWSGQVIEPVDGMAFIGRNPMDSDNVYIVTGDSGHGMTHGTIAGMILADLIAGRDNPWATLYDPRRRTLRAAGEFAKENLNVFVQYADWLKKGDVEEIDDIPPGQGAIVRQGTQLLAVYKDEQGVPSACSAVCPHLAGIVRWNRAESTWDCPCHGSRFAPTGEVVEGPAISGLEKVPVARLRGQEELADDRATPLMTVPT